MERARVENAPGFVEIDRKLLPEARWIYAGMLDWRQPRRASRWRADGRRLVVRQGGSLAFLE
ncbi:hypothetical protein [Labrys sp. ZIDIC5]|uniref:hypothetical protein n=1 Tax=Labrys sedimenti TaxID=3106036 RepID=UPI002ACA820B|nr:hypothetical protein [Labrys sp. ZIDIC5]MDZ5454322.1 hypothetical protein [Labrys sp. ZIDIC5]